MLLEVRLFRFSICNTFSINISPKTDVECDLSGRIGVFLVLTGDSRLCEYFGQRCFESLH